MNPLTGRILDSNSNGWKYDVFKSSYATSIDTTDNDPPAVIYILVNGKQCTEIIASGILIFPNSLQHILFSLLHFLGLITSEIYVNH